ncbi:ABC transporter permease [Chondrinema litorale]|uniref:ABC transporter permease n=1 Tax=Chondrinema litorale TaxID=2994555 RepID=UPI002542B719|nr:ABC transporter permease [Chondrinema litorale]UZR94409.1 ABC transporter permease [Chondrinema litorale]
MFKNYITIALRNLLKHKFYSFINVAGLSVGIVCCILILLYVKDELSYDQYNEKAPQIYRAVAKGMFGGNEFHAPQMPSPFAETTVRDFPEVLQATRIRQRGNFLVRYDTPEGEIRSFREEEIAYVDSNFFNVFSIPLVTGEASTVLKDPNTVVINKKTAEKYFGKDNPVGKSIKINDRTDFTVTGVFDKIPENSHFNFDMLFSMETLDEAKNGFWMSFNFHTYLVLQENSDPNQLESKFPDMIVKYIGPEIERFMGASFDEFVKAGNSMNFTLQPLVDIHLKSDLMGELAANNDIKYIYIFSAIAAFILIIACINFMNLSTARSANRAKEVGVRKVMGSYRRQLIWQFLTESVIISIIAFIIASVSVPFLLDAFNEISGKEMTINYFEQYDMLLYLFAGAVFTGILAGSYPAFFLSSFTPAKVLKGNIRSGAKSGMLRSILVIFQFGISIILIVGTMIVYNQLEYIQSKNLGYNKEQVLILENTYVLGRENVQSLKNELLQNSAVKAATITADIPINGANNNTAYFPGNDPKSDQTTVLSQFNVDFDFIKAMGIDIIEGRDFNIENAADSNSLVVNEATVKHFGWTDPIGQEIGTFISDDGEVKIFKVIGVAKNFHFESLRQNIRPLVIQIGSWQNRIAVRYEAGKTKDVIDEIEGKWKRLAPGQPFNYTFMDESFAKNYEQEQKVGKLFGIFAGLAIFIACLGLFGLASFTAEQRTKEIGIRKVLGASVVSIIVLLSKEFGKLLIIAFVIASPLAWYIMHLWLRDFAFKTDITPITFVVAGAIAFSIAWVTMSYQSLKAAIAKPVKSLKAE